MKRGKFYIFFFVLLAVSMLGVSCHHHHKGKNEIVSNPESMDDRISDDIQQTLEDAEQDNGKVDDTIHLQFVKQVDSFYNGNGYTNIWSHKEKWVPLADSLFSFIEHARLDGLFPSDYHFKNLSSLKKKLDSNKVSRTDAVLWTNADLMLTDGFMHIVHDLKIGRIQQDSIQLNPDSVLSFHYYSDNLNRAISSGNIAASFDSLEPTIPAYQQLKQCLKSFLDTMNWQRYTYVVYPINGKSPKDSLAFVQSLRKRLCESECIDSATELPDSVKLSTAIKHYQKKNGLKADGLVSTSLIQHLNDNDVERYKRIAITMDKYKLLPDTMPEKYIWVNLPEYYMRVWDHDTVAILSKVVCGKPTTRTPLLNGAITNMVTYPTWTIPNSIIVKQFLPKLQADATYLSHLGLHLVDKKGDPVDPKMVKWKKYKRGIPYQIVQGSGDDNALGVLKFNFNNKYSVYLHDTNERNLFSKNTRCLSHGCVRVQEWEQLAFFIIRNDSVNLKPGLKLRYNTDSLVNILARKEKKTIDVHNRLPVFIRYFTCEAKDGKIIFYDDMYGEDAFIRDKYFANK